MAKKTKYLLTLAKKDNGTNVGCIAITMEDDKVVKEKIIIDVFPGINLQKEVFEKWAWAEKIPKEDKTWISTQTELDDVLNRLKEKLIARVIAYHPFNFVGYKMIDLLNEFAEANNRDATSLEVNLIISMHIKRVLTHFEENPSEKSNFPIIDYLKNHYAHTGENISLDSITKSFNLINK